MASDNIRILFIEDNEGDIRLMREALQELNRHRNLTVIRDGETAWQELQQQGEQFGLVLLDLNLPKKGGRELLELLKSDENLRHLPVIVLTSSDDEKDIRHTYKLHANCYITKPPNLNAYIDMVKAIDHFWLSVARLPVTRSRRKSL